MNNEQVYITVPGQIAAEVTRLKILDAETTASERAAQMTQRKEDMEWMTDLFQRIFGYQPDTSDLETMRITADGVTFGAIVDDYGYVSRWGICRVVPCETCGVLRFSHPMTTLEEMARFEMSPVFTRWHDCKPPKTKETPYVAKHLDIVISSPATFAEKCDRKIEEGWTLFSTVMILDDDGYAVMATFTKA